MYSSTIEEEDDSDIVIAIESTGIKVTNRGIPCPLFHTGHAIRYRISNLEKQYSLEMSYFNVPGSI